MSGGLRIPWFRHRFLLRRKLDRFFLDVPDALYRRAVGRGHWPGEYLYSAEVVTAGPAILIRFELDTWYGPSSIDERELGLLVAFTSASEPLPRGLQPLELR